MKAHLWVLEEGILVVHAAACSVKKWLIIATPGAPQHSLLPCLMETQV